MKLERLELSNFLSWETCDWSPNGARLATLSGPNGAGKSALLDALLYALYDSARGRTDELVRLGATDMSAVVTFVFGGARYRVSRGRTTRSGGKSFLELAVEQADGFWRPLTADSIRETQAAIEALIRLDAATFTTAAFLRQGDADAFIIATAAERKRILGSVLGLDVWAAAEARARERVRTVEAETAADRRRIEALDAGLARRPELEAAAVVARAEEEAATAVMATAGARRDAAEEQLRSLAGQIAEAKAAQDDLARIDAELAALRDRYRRAGEGRAAAQAAIERTRAAAEIEIPEHDVGAARAAVADLEAHFEMDRASREALELNRMTLRGLEATWERACAEWRRTQSTAAGRIAALEDQAAHLEPVTCPGCGTRFPADPGDVAGRLTRERADYAAIGDEPTEPTAIAEQRAVITSEEQRLAEGAIDPGVLQGAREAMRAAERAEAAVVARDAARASLADAEAALGRADAELAEIDTTGKAMRVTRDAAAERAEPNARLTNDYAIAEGARHDAVAAASMAARQHADAIASSVEAAGALRHLEAAQEERDVVALEVRGAEEHLGRLRRLVAAFGVGGIPARIIESVLPELTGYAQELLEQLRPGMELSIRAQRAKRDGTGIVEALDLVVRDAVGERSLSLFSGGERMSVSLALAVGLSRLVARRAGTAIRSLVIDEPDGLDAEARRSFGQALRLLAHHGELERVVVVSHHEDLAEIGDAVYAVRKVDGRSVVEQVA